VAAYAQLPNLFVMVMMMIFGVVVGLLAKFSFGRSLILQVSLFVMNPSMLLWLNRNLNLS